MKPYFRSKGNYKDGRKRIIIEFMEKGKLKSCALPKPELLLKLIGQDNLDNNDKGK